MKINFIVLKFLLILTFYLHINNWNLLYNKNFPISLMRWIFIEYKVLKNTSNININNNKNNNNNYINSNEYKKNIYNNKLFEYNNKKNNIKYIKQNDPLKLNNN